MCYNNLRIEKGAKDMRRTRGDVPSEVNLLIRRAEQRIEEVKSRPIDQLFEDEAEYLKSIGIDPRKWSTLSKKYPILHLPKMKKGSIAEALMKDYSGKLQIQEQNPILVRRACEMMRLQHGIELIKAQHQSTGLSPNWRNTIIRLPSL